MSYVAPRSSQPGCEQTGIEVFAGGGEQRVEALARAERIVRHPVHLELHHEPQSGCRLSGDRRPLERHVHVRPLALRGFDLRRLRRVGAQVQTSSELGENSEQPAQKLVAFRRLETLGAELANRLEHPEAGLLSKRRSRLLSRSDSSSSMSAPQTRSADSGVQPPRKTDSAASSRCSSCVRRSYDHSIVARSVR